MDKFQAIHSFWSRFGILAYDESSVPDDAQFPYLTYSVMIDSLDYPVTLTADLYYRSTSWTEISQKTEQIDGALINGEVIKLDTGYLWIVKGHPFAQRVTEEDDTIKHIYIVLSAEFLTQ